MKELTPRQNLIFKYVRDSIKLENHTPSVLEIGKRFKITPGGVVHHLQFIEAKGFLAREPGKSRSIKILVDPYDVDNVPILGEVVDKKLVRSEIPKRIDLGELFNDPRCFVIMRGDEYLVVRKQRSARQGQTVAVIDYSDQFFLKTWPYTEPPNVKLLGRLVGVVQSFS